MPYRAEMNKQKKKVKISYQRSIVWDVLRNNLVVFYTEDHLWQNYTDICPALPDIFMHIS